MSHILPFSDDAATLANSGGKGVNLARLSRLGLPVPPGFIVTTAAYDQFVRTASLAPLIENALHATDSRDSDSLEAASLVIRAAFSEAAPRLSDVLTGEILSAYRGLGASAVAVRSSATAEDLPELSFAGQQDTFLNVIGEAALLQAVAACWSSLWTARAIGYRARNGIASEGIALAVIVQAMVQSQASGVLFTANPLTGQRNQVVIDATLGLGEALVSGQTEPDHYVVDATDVIVARTLGAKTVQTVGEAGGGIRTIRVDASAQQAIPDEVIAQLAGLGRQVAAEYDEPQDIEWAWSGGRVHLLQSRAITSLYPMLEATAADDLRACFSFGAVQGVLDPFTPLGQDFIRTAFAGGARMFGYDLDWRTLRVVRLAGERLWIDVTAPMRNSVGRTVIQNLLSAAEPGAAQALRQLVNDSQLQTTQRGLKLSTLARIGRGFAPIAARVVRNWRHPDRRPRQLREQMDARVAAWRAQAPPATLPPRQRIAAVAGQFDAFEHQLTEYVPDLFAAVFAGVSMLLVLDRLLAHAGDAPAAGGFNPLALQLTRGLANNVTTEMDLVLTRVARAIRAEPAIADSFRDTGTNMLAAAYRNGSLPPVAQQEVEAFLKRFGMRGLGEIDLGRPRWREQPEQILDALRSYLSIVDAAAAPDAVFARSEKQAEAAAAAIVSRVRKSRGGRLKARVARFAIHRLRAFGGLRELPKFVVIQHMDELRTALLESGRALVEDGDLARADDLFYLRRDELRLYAAGEKRDWSALIGQRRARELFESRRRQIPRLLLSDGRAYYAGMGATPDGAVRLTGSPVSPGVAEGFARIVLDPHSAGLQPGEILVCPGTDPAWTPLFFASAALITEVGGMMTHGAVVAREFGIPAVVGVHDATRRIQTGQHLRVDGSSGVITLLDAPTPAN